MHEVHDSVFRTQLAAVSMMHWAQTTIIFKASLFNRPRKNLTYRVLMLVCAYK